MFTKVLTTKLQVTKRVADGGNDYGGWENWNWRSSGDMFLNGAFFTDSGSSNVDSSLYAKATSFAAKPSSSVGTLTANAGPFQCGLGVLSQTCSSPPHTFHNNCSFVQAFYILLSFATHAELFTCCLGSCFLIGLLSGMIFCPLTRALFVCIEQGYLSCDAGTPNTYGGPSGSGSSPGWYSSAEQNPKIAQLVILFSLIYLSTLSILCM
jgi:hypothetical protein